MVGDTIKLDRVLRLLTDSKRREVVILLREHDPAPVDRLEPEDAEKVELHHRHLPRLESAGVISWNDEDDVIGRGERYRQVENALAAVEEGLPAHYRQCENNPVADCGGFVR